jgi:PST family polysaccharide transporter
MLQKIKSFLFRNTTAKQTVAKNTVWLTISNFGGRAIKAVIIIYAARVLGTAGYGVFSYVITLAGFCTFFVDPGVNYILMRETSKADETRQQELFSTTFVMKLTLIAATVLFIVFGAPHFSTLPGAKVLLPIAALVVAADTLREFFSSLLRARERMEWEAGVFLLTNAGILALGFVFLVMTPTPRALLWGYALGTVLGALAATWAVRNQLKDLLARASRRLVMPIVRAAWPFAITGALGSLLTSADIFIVSWMRGASDVGIYSAAVRIVQVLYVIPMVLQYSTLPLLSRLAHQDDARFRTIFERTISVVFLLSVPLALGGLILGTPIMQFVFGAAYGGGGLSFKILMLTLLFDFPLTIIGAAIFAYDRQKNLIVSAIIAGVLNTGFDLALIPIFGIAGSALATLLAQAATNWYLWRKMNQINRFSVFPRLGRIIAAGLGMALVVAALALLHMHVLVSIAAGGITYLLLLYLLREPLLREMRSIARPAPEVIS